LATSLAWFGHPPLGAVVHDLPRATRQGEARSRDDLLAAIHRA